MGEIADSIINGDFCETCGKFLGKGDGFPRSCCDESHYNFQDEIDFDEEADEETTLEDVETDVRVLLHDIRVFKENADINELTEHQKKFINNVETLLENYFKEEENNDN